MGLKIVIADCSWRSMDVEKRHLPPDAEVLMYQIADEDELIAACRDADAILAEYAPFTAKVLCGLKKCRIISNTAIGYNNIDVAAAKEKRITVANVPGYCAYEVAEHTMALILASLRNVVSYDRLVRKRVWDIAAAAGMRRIAGQTLGLAGFGNIPRFVARRARGFEFNILAYDPYVKQETADQFGVTMVDIGELLAKSDVISCHIPMTAETAGFFNADKFARMKNGALFINTSRGGVVNENDLCAALKSGHLAGAALDVMENEPPGFSGGLFSLDNVIITPHAAFCSEESLEEVRRRSAQNVTNFFNGSGVVHRVC